MFKEEALMRFKPRPLPQEPSPDDCDVSEDDDAKLLKLQIKALEKNMKAEVKSAGDNAPIVKNLYQMAILRLKKT